MKIIRNGATASLQGPAAWFTGQVRIDGIQVLGQVGQAPGCRRLQGLQLQGVPGLGFWRLGRGPFQGVHEQAHGCCSRAGGRVGRAGLRGWASGGWGKKL